MNGLALEDGRKVSYMFVSLDEFMDRSRAIKMDTNETTGRVVLWGWDARTFVTKVLVGGLVSYRFARAEWITAYLSAFDGYYITSGSTVALKSRYQSVQIYSNYTCHYPG
jgi:hypothetical protein